MFRNSARPKAIRIVLGLYGLLAVIFGLSYTSILRNESLPAPPGLDLITNVLPIWVWGGLWMAAGAMGILSVFTSLRWEFRIGFNVLVWLQMVWTFSYFIHWIFNRGLQSASRDYVAAVLFAFGAVGLIGIIQLLAPMPPAPSRFRRRRAGRRHQAPIKPSAGWRADG